MLEATPSGVEGQISTTRHADRRRGVRELRQTIPAGCYTLFLPLRRSRIDTACNGKTLHRGTIMPGMLRLGAPGEEIQSNIYTVFEWATVRIPLRQVAGRDWAELSLNHSSPRDRVLLEPSSQVAQLSHALLQADDFDPHHAQLFSAGLVQALLACLLRQKAGWPSATEIVKRAGLSAADMARAVAFAEARMADTLSLEDWAASIQMRPGEFTKRFRRTTGNSPYAWFMGWRIERAKTWLHRPKASLCDVALRCGFSSQSHFTEAFRRRVGVSPARWRAAKQG